MDILEKIDLALNEAKIKKGMVITKEKDGRRGEIIHISGDGEIIEIEWFDGKDTEPEIPLDLIKKGKFTVSKPEK